MRVRLPTKSTTIRRGATRRDSPRRSGPAELPARPVAAAPERHRRAGGPEDQALYSCHCGYVFEASVSASVACPHCGAGQAW